MSVEVSKKEQSKKTFEMTFSCSHCSLGIPWTIQEKNCKNNMSDEINQCLFIEACEKMVSWMSPTQILNYTARFCIKIYFSFFNQYTNEYVNCSLGWLANYKQLGPA